MIEFLVTVLVLAIVIYVVDLVIGMLSLPPQVRTIALLIVGLVGLVYILQIFGVNLGIGFPRLR